MSNNELVPKDYYDRSFEETEMARQEFPINKFDGLIHAQNGHVYDPATMREVELEETSAIQTRSNDWYDEDFDRKQNYLGEPIGTVQKKIAEKQALLQTGDWYDTDFERKEQMREQAETYKYNKFDGLFHDAKTGKSFDAKGKLVQEQLDLAQKRSMKKDWCDSGIKGTDWCAQEEEADLNERTKQQEGLMFAQRRARAAAKKNKRVKGWCDKQITDDQWCDQEVEAGVNEKTADDKSLYEGPTKAAWQLEDAEGNAALAQIRKQKRDWCDSGIKGTDWCAQEEEADLNERTKQQEGLMFAQRRKAHTKRVKGWCDKQITDDQWCDQEVEAGVNEKTADDKSLYEGPTKAAW